MGAIVVAPQLVFACGNDFNAAYEMTKHGGVQENPMLFIHQVKDALKQCDHLIELRKEEKRSDDLDSSYLANRKNCEEMNKEMNGYNEQDMAVTFCFYTAEKAYGWGVMAQNLRNELKQ